MKYLIPFAILRKELMNGSGGLTDEQVIAAVRRMLPAVTVDETWYLTRYPDVAEAVRTGSRKSAQAHFVEDGYFEGRQPFAHELDEEWYLSTYNDIAQGIEAGEISSALEHYDQHGYHEGRL